MTDKTVQFEAAALRLAAAMRRALSLISGGEAGLTLAEAAEVCGLRAPVSEADLAQLARVCERDGITTNLDGEVGGEWWRLRQAAAAQLLDERATQAAARLARPVLDVRPCLFCGGRRHGRAFGASLCHTCGALTRDGVVEGFEVRR